MALSFIVKSWRLLVAFLAILLIILGLVWYEIYYRGALMTQISPSPTFKFDLNLGNSLLQKDPLEASQMYEVALNEATTPEERNKAQFMLAASYWYSDHMKAVDALKAIVQNTQSPPEYRAAGINQLVAIASDRFASDRILVDRIFTGPGWQTLIDQFRQSPYYTSSTTKLSVYINGIRLGYEWSESIMPTPEATYALAGWFATGAIIPGNSESQKDAALAKKFLAQGDALIAAHQKDGFPFPVGVNPSSYMITKEIARVQLYRLGVDKDVTGIINELTNFIAFSQASQIAGNVYYNEFARYALAATLAFSGASPGAIHTVLLPLYQSSANPQFLAFLRNQHNAVLDYAPLYNPWSIAIAKADPSFRKLLLGAGWQDADFKG